MPINNAGSYALFINIRFSSISCSHSDCNFRHSKKGQKLWRTEFACDLCTQLDVQSCRCWNNEVDQVAQTVSICPPLSEAGTGIHLRTYLVALKRTVKTSPLKYPQGQTDSSNWRSSSSLLLWFACLCLCPQLGSELCGAVCAVGLLLPNTLHWPSKARAIIVKPILQVRELKNREVK